MDENNGSSDLTEKETREKYIDQLLFDSGWKIGKNCLTEFEVYGMPNSSSKGFVDYVCLDDDRTPLCIVEAKRTSVDVEVGRTQASIYADLLEKKYNRRPMIFLSNGYSVIAIDTRFGERNLYGIYSKKDLQKYFEIYKNKENDLSKGTIDSNIVDREYQIRAVRAVLREYEVDTRRALLVMATGTGKTRTAAAIIDLMIRKHWIRNILFLADRSNLLLQAEKAIKKHIPSLPLAQILNCPIKSLPNYRCLFSTYETVSNRINERSEDGSRILSPGFFDLIIIDEAHRSIYNKYRSIFNHFDAYLLGLTATPKSDLNRDTFEFFGMKDGTPTDSYEIEDGIREGYLVPYRSVETTVKFLDEGIHYDDLTEEEREKYEEAFGTGGPGDFIDSHAMNKFVFNKDTNIKVINDLMANGLKVEMGTKIGKTIIFASNHKHAEFIQKMFYDQYKNYPHDFCKVIDTYDPFAQKVLNDFSNPNKYPQIAISVDMLDTGVDIPEILNLVFFKKVFTKSKFIQMLGRGTRTCKGLIDGKDKEMFCVFDYCRVFEYFRENPKGLTIKSPYSLQAGVFKIRSEIAYWLIDRVNENTKEYYETLINEQCGKVSSLDRGNYAVQQEIKLVEEYSNIDRWRTLIYPNIDELYKKIGPLLSPYDSDFKAVLFDYELFVAEYNRIMNSSIRTEKITTCASELLKKTTIPMVMEKKQLLEFASKADNIASADLHMLEKIRMELRGLMKFLDGSPKVLYHSDLTDEITDVVTNEPNHEMTRFTDIFTEYVQTHLDSGCIWKIRHLIPLDEEDINELESILCDEHGSSEEFDKYCIDNNLIDNVNNVDSAIWGIAGIDRDTLSEMIYSRIDEEGLSNCQKSFVEKVIDHISINGPITDKTILSRKPFSDKGSIAKDFDDNYDTLRLIIEGIDIISEYDSGFKIISE